jgi:DNA-binding MarR family transcriptional regulator
VTHPKGLRFVDLKRLCGLTDGNLSRHLQALEAATLIEISKDIERKRLQTRCRITAVGRRRHLEYIELLERVIRDSADSQPLDIRGPARLLSRG